MREIPALLSVTSLAAERERVGLEGGRPNKLAINLHRHRRAYLSEVLGLRWKGIGVDSADEKRQQNLASSQMASAPSVAGISPRRSHGAS